MWALLAIGLGITIWQVFFAGPDYTTVIVADIVFLVTMGIAAIACFATARRLGAVGWPWTWFGLGCVAWFTGQAIWAGYDVFTRTSPPYPSLADIGYTLAYPLVGIGLVGLITTHRAGSPTFEVMLDSLLVAMVAGTVTYDLLIRPTVDIGAESSLGLIVSLSWTVGTVFLLFLTLVAFIWIDDPADRPAVTLLLLGVGGFAVSDILYSRQSLEGTYQLGNPSDLGWNLGLLLMTAAAVLAGRRTVITRSRRAVSRPDPSALARTAIVAASVLIVTVFLTFDAAERSITYELLTIGGIIALRLAFATIASRKLVLRTWERDRLYEDLQAELRRAAEIQASLLPNAVPAIAGYEVAGCCLPARQIGGDFFDWNLRPDGILTVTLADVMGKGVPASLMMATARAALRTATHLPVAETTETVNRALYPDLRASDSFVTLFHAALDPEHGEVRFADAGHGMAFVLRHNGPVRTLRQHDLPLGLGPATTYRDGRVALTPGDTLVIYSDGLPDARPDLMLDSEGIASQLESAAGAQAMLDRLVHLAGPGEHRPDDLTLVIVRRLDEATGSAGHS